MHFATAQHPTHSLSSHQCGEMDSPEPLRRALDEFPIVNYPSPTCAAAVALDSTALPSRCLEHSS